MIEKLKKFKKQILFGADLLLINLALIVSFMLRFDANWLQYFNFYYLLLISVIGILALYFLKVYNKIWKYVSITELKIIIQASLLINLLFTVIVFLGGIPLARSIVVINFFIQVCFLGGIRFAFRISKNYYINYLNSNQNKDNVLMVGAGDAAEAIIRETDKYPLKKEIIGLVDDDPHKHGLEIHNRKVLGDRYAIPGIIESYDIKEVIIAIPSVRGKVIKEIYNLSNQEGVKVSILPALDEILTKNVSLSQIREVRVEDLLGRDQVDLNIEDICSYLKDKTVLVTGGGGSIGSELCRQIARFEPQQLLILDIYENNTYFLELELKEKYPALEIVPIIASIRDQAKLKQIFIKHRPDVVFHAAAHKHVPLMESNPREAVKNNILGTEKVARAADEFGTERFVLISTDKAVNPTNVMGATKRVAEMLIQAVNKESQTKFMAVRFGNVLGSHGSVIPLFKKQIKAGGPVTVTHEEVERYFMTIPEASQLVIEAGALGQGGEVFLLDMGQPVKIIDLARDLIELSGLEVGEDIEIEITGLRPGEKMYEELLTEKEDNLATEHERIFKAQLEKIDTELLYQNIDKLKKLIELSNSAAIIKCLVKLVGTYEPNRDFADSKVIDLQEQRMNDRG
ncbi:polysaccharide biosynthesis protein [Fuchsiella alkaliacetigena]|uniref:polysaccharide biosynthesis protein n=1 Tax=Fuchsiella alkaliacetigena TaxID=957042 RepID=UPI00200AB51F|nr:nucleoside-diphosphate sugar epimerase/dehydratase [Fuchsiella alkaliacetigena]MCK8825886.1 polysaccharide biosynthesis protein [Fuchsiella alkaliacetigena]